MGRVNVYYSKSYFRGKALEQTESVVTINPSDTVFLKVKPSIASSNGFCLEMSVNGNTESLGAIDRNDVSQSKAAVAEKMYEILDAIDEAEKNNRTIDVYMDSEKMPTKDQRNTAKRQEGIGLD